ncbi:hypothetical protein F4560_004519 [Saccharothrix ecbatanensis]|uniref:Uncharacterized protein n=1 Tax=Saccharothrix ecbatanensis TaxID=1105145 RepID=A0A7W9HMB1_9PSEU|nr:hypothetical protein [Saccharothrix ecbatanensis]MBB5804751.1 hypothetical protein [Saccharothrix ecbatanensis]
MSLNVSIGAGEELHLRGAMEGRVILTIGLGIEIVFDRGQLVALHDQASVALRDVDLVAAADERLDVVSDAAAYARTAAGRALRQAESARSHDDAERVRVAARAAIAAADAANAAVEAAVEAMLTAEDATDKVVAAVAAGEDTGTAGRIPHLV